MKNLIIVIVFILLSWLATAQSILPENSQVFGSIVFEPKTTPNNISVGAEYGASLDHMYIRTGLQTSTKFNNIKIAWVNSIGATLPYDNNTIYGGIRGTIIQNNPSYGFELGWFYTFDNDITVGVRVTEDYKYQFETLENTPDWRLNGFLTIGKKFL